MNKIFCFYKFRVYAFFSRTNCVEIFHYLLRPQLLWGWARTHESKRKKRVVLCSWNFILRTKNVGNYQVFKKRCFGFSLASTSWNLARAQVTADGGVALSNAVVSRVFGTVIALSNLKVIFSFSGPAGGAVLRRRLDQRWLRLALFLHSVLWTHVVYCGRGARKIYRRVVGVRLQTLRSSRKQEWQN